MSASGLVLHHVNTQRLHDFLGFFLYANMPYTTPRASPDSALGPLIEMSSAEPGFLAEPPMVETTYVPESKGSHIDASCICE